MPGLGKVKASAEVNRICGGQYATVRPPRDPCDSCPLRSPCITHAPVGRLSLEKMDAWTERKNQLAETLHANSKG